jgi:hypothetical protein
MLAFALPVSTYHEPQASGFRPQESGFKRIRKRSAFPLFVELGDLGWKH